MSESRDQDALDAARWRAFVSAQRIRLFGWAGYDKVDPNGDPSGNYRHFGAEFWSIHTHPTEDPDQVRKILEGFADAIIKEREEKMQPKVTFVSKHVAMSITTPSLLISVQDRGDEPTFFVDHLDVLKVGYNGVGDLITNARDDIEAFLIKHPNADIVVHCTYGESRSAAIAKWLSERHGFTLDLEYPGCNGRVDGYNKLLYRELTGD